MSAIVLPEATSSWSMLSCGPVDPPSISPQVVAVEVDLVAAEDCDVIAAAPFEL
jgi:hypothetical protein